MTVFLAAGGDAEIEAGECAMAVEDAVEIAEIDTALAVSSTSMISELPAAPCTDPVCGGGKTVVFTMVETVEEKAADERGAETDDDELAI